MNFNKTYKRRDIIEDLGNDQFISEKIKKKRKITCKI